MTSTADEGRPGGNTGHGERGGDPPCCAGLGEHIDSDYLYWLLE